MPDINKEIAEIKARLEKLRPLQERLSGLTEVITYNRAGYGRSEASPLPQDCGRGAIRNN